MPANATPPKPFNSSGEFFFDVKNFVLDPAKSYNMISSNRKASFTSNVHIKFHQPGIQKARMSLFKNYLAIFIQENPLDKTRLPTILINVLFLYLRSKTGHQKSRIQFELATNNFSLELFFFNDPELCYKWMQVLGKFCVKKNLSEDFKLKKKLDKGGFAVVYLGERKRDGALFALKFMDKRKVENEKSYRYTINEIKLMRGLNHPNIAKLYDVYDIENHLVLVIEYMNRGNLTKKIKGGPIPEKIAYKVIHGVFEALAYMHRLGVVHRDLKPGNIMFRSCVEAEGGELDPDLEEMKVIDFGLCANLKDHSETSLLNDKSGTVGYLAPELIAKKKGEFYDDRVDVFSAGMIFYEMLVGKNPFKAGSYEKSMYRNYKCELDFNLVGISSETRFFLRCVLSKSPETRPTAERVLEDEWCLKLELDENYSRAGILSQKIKRTPKFTPFLKTITDEKQENQPAPKLDPKLLASAIFRYENSTNAASYLSHLTLKNMDLSRTHFSRKNISQNANSHILRSMRRVQSKITPYKSKHVIGKYRTIEGSFRGRQAFGSFFGGDGSALGFGDTGSEDIISSEENNPINGYMANYA